MKNGSLKLLPLLVFVAAGCNSEPPANPQSTPTTTTDGSKTSAPDSAPASAATPPTQSAPTSPTPPTSAPTASVPTPTTGAKTASTDVVPAALKHEGYQYSGVDHHGPIDMEETTSAQPGVVTTGSQTITFTGIKNGKAVYNVDHTGGLAVLGSEEWAISTEGVFTTKSSVANFGDKAMELPADPKPGMTWKVSMKASRADENMDTENTMKIIGKDNVTTKAGTFKDALVVEQIGVGTLQSKKVRTVSKSWYVKGIGLVKADMKITTDGKTQTVLIQETNAK